MEQELKAIAARRFIPPDFSVRYDDSHTLWGGTTIVIRANGSAQRREMSRGGFIRQNFETVVPRSQLLEFVEFLIKHEAWKQISPSRLAVSDEVRGVLTIEGAGQMSMTWEWFGEMPENRRLIQIKENWSS